MSDLPINSVSSIYGPASIIHPRRDGRGRGNKGFEEALGEDPAEREGQGLEEEPPQGAQSTLVPLQKRLQGHVPRGRKDDQGQGHIDVLA